VFADLPNAEVLEYLVGKTIPLPDTPGGAENAQKKVEIQRRGVKQLAWESAGSIGGDKIHSHHYALLYDAGDAHYFAELDVDVRQVGEKRAYLGVQMSNVRKADLIVHAPPK
jgi:hypothetical protein